jgi:hypothetical protein
MFVMHVDIILVAVSSFVALVIVILANAQDIMRKIATIV